MVIHEVLKYLCSSLFSYALQALSTWSINNWAFFFKSIQCEKNNLILSPWMKETTKGADFFSLYNCVCWCYIGKNTKECGVCPTSNKTQPPRHCLIKSRHLWASLNTLLSLLHAHQPSFCSSDKPSLFLLGPLHLAATSVQNTLLPGCLTCFNLSFMTQLIHHLLRDAFPGPLLNGTFPS